MKTTEPRRMIAIFKSASKPDYYLFVDRRRQLEDIPEPLREHFGKPVRVTDMLLTADRKLAQADAERVLEKIEHDGYYLQMPPPKEPSMLELFRNSPDRGNEVI